MSNHCTAPVIARTTGRPIQVTNLLLTGTELSALLRRAVVSEQWCDAFLLSAGMLQLADDALHPDPFDLRRAASYLGKRASLSARGAGLGAAALAGAFELRQWGSRARRLSAARSVLAELTCLLASAVLQPGSVSPETSELGVLVARAVAAAPLLGADVARLPACFRDFDLHPEDVRALAGRLHEVLGVTGGPVCVLGVRTSGSYLAPLLAAALRHGGVSEVLVLTHRPKHPFLSWEGQALRRTARAGGWVLVIDDPPATGTALGATLKAVAATGVPPEATALALPLFTDEEGLPAQLRDYVGALLPWSSWSVHRRLEGTAVAATLSDLLGTDWSVDQCERRKEVAPAHGAKHRDHVRARYALHLTDRSTGQSERRELVVEGAGLGYLGGQALVVADRLRDDVPPVHGLAAGLLYREWLPKPPSPADEVGLATAIAAYVARRQQVLPTSTDPTSRMRGREPVWEVTAELLSRPFGWAAPAFRGLLESMTRRLLTPSRLSVVDGATAPSRWFPDPSEPGRLRKVDFHQGAMGHWGASCYDALFDLAGAACEPVSVGFADLLCERYEALTGERPDDERLLLYRLAQLWRLDRSGELRQPHALGRHSAAAVHDFLAACYLDGLAVPAGPLCAVDLDGVLETDRLGYPCTTPTGMMALRALAAHGYRVVLATGRGMDEARDRCKAFGLAGAVAEYGTAVYTTWDGGTADLRDALERALLDDVREQLTRRGVLVLPTHSYAVRARLRGGPLPAELTADIPLLSDPRLRLVQGEAQTDVTIARLDKSTGLARLADSLHVSGVALAVGDTAADLTMLRTASIARAPGNADAAVRAAGIPLTRHSYQSGLADACAALLGHRPGHCPACRMPDLPPPTRDLLALLALSEPGLPRLPLRTARVAGRVAAGAPKKAGSLHG